MTPLPGVSALWTRLTAAAFACLALATCCMLVVLVPLGQVVDEGAHLVRAAAIGEGQLVGRRGPETQPDGTQPLVAGVDVDAVLPAISGGPPEEGRRRSDAPAWSPERRFVPIHTVATYMPAFYVPAAAGLAAARALGYGPAAAVTAGRIAVALAFVLIGTAALLVARQGQALLFACLALPMTLSLAASYNQDGLIIATGVLAVACLTRALSDRSEGRPGGASLAGAAVCLALVIAAKPPYAPLAAMLVLPFCPTEPGSSPRRLVIGIAVAALVVLPALLWTGYVMRSVSAPIPRPPYEAGPLWPGERPARFAATDPGQQLRVLFAHPVQILYLPWRFLTSVRRLTVLGEGVIGLLGWLSVRLQLWHYLAWAATLAASLWVFARPGRGDGARDPSRRWRIAVVALAAFGTIWAVFLSQYLSWTDVGETSIVGPQGRYLLPILPLLALLPARDGSRRDTTPRNLAWLPAAAMLAGLFALHRLVLATYGAG